jgi:hypothetical protein
MSRTVVCAVSIALTALCAAAATAGTAGRASSRASFPPKSFTDASGDNGTAADVRTVTVTNDGTGQYTIDVELGTPYVSTDGMLVFLDTDENPATGDTSAAGAEYLLVEDHGTRSFAFEQWDGSQFVDATATATLSVTVTPNNHFLFSFNRSEVGDSAAFDFYVVSVDGDGSAGHADDAPSGSGTYAYELQSLRLTAAASSESAATAGATWTIRLAAKRSDTGETVGSEGTIACRAGAGGKRLALAAKGLASSGGVKAAFCRFRVPKALKHKLLHGTLTIGYQGQSVMHVFAARAK